MKRNSIIGLSLMLCFVIFGALSSVASAQVSLTVPAAFDPGTLANGALTFSGPYLTSIAALVFLTGLVIGLFRRFGRTGRSIPR